MILHVDLMSHSSYFANKTKLTQYLHQSLLPVAKKGYLYWDSIGALSPVLSLLSYPDIVCTSETFKTLNILLILVQSHKSKNPPTNHMSISPY